MPYNSFLYGALCALIVAAPINAKPLLRGVLPDVLKKLIVLSTVVIGQRAVKYCCDNICSPVRCCAVWSRQATLVTHITRRYCCPESGNFTSLLSQLVRCCTTVIVSYTAAAFYCAGFAPMYGRRCHSAVKLNRRLAVFLYNAPRYNCGCSLCWCLLRYGWCWSYHV